MGSSHGQLVETEDAGQVDTVSGATSSSEKFQEYAAMLLNAAENGETDTLEVDNEVD
ncbi:FMN-binding protein [Alkalibacterium thalassium]|uniref:FMN-binding protein n=1 Tax=Alkalibacterium thalassium TaxID=426701 RepID=UPI001FDEBD6F|nr:FMN-binding protein [Alkalibacterium thalassium]